ncbi:hypothetical protein FHS54_001709 [Sphingobium vermicomposti]|uniref:Uncharacterized protein n=1 Tax=Sphingobium vermicomposti TaxID=529005 RepID=A0A846M5E4_9SPHN|nr:hypothetical protein [Sphingobium vermicomposti]
MIEKDDFCPLSTVPMAQCDVDANSQTRTALSVARARSCHTIAMPPFTCSVWPVT